MLPPGSDGVGDGGGDTLKIAVDGIATIASLDDSPDIGKGTVRRKTSTRAGGLINDPHRVSRSPRPLCAGGGRSQEAGRHKPSEQQRTQQIYVAVLSFYVLFF